MRLKSLLWSLKLTAVYISRPVVSDIKNMYDNICYLFSADTRMFVNAPFQPLAVHCHMGRGRTGTMLACYLLQSRGIDASTAIREIRRMRPGSIETSEQERLVHTYQKHITLWWTALGNDSNACVRACVRAVLIVQYRFERNQCKHRTSVYIIIFI